MPGLAPALLLLAACGLDPDRVADHVPWSDDGVRVEVDGPLRIAVVGDVRDAVPGADAAEGAKGPSVADEVVADIVRHSADLDLVVLLGDVVRVSTAAEWRRFDRRFADLLVGTTPDPDPSTPRVAGIPVAGDHDAARDPRYRGLGGAWPGAGAHIGYGRVGTWGAFDVVTAGSDWRLVVLDTGRDHLGSRWNEQLRWIDRMAERPGYEHVVVFMHEGLFDLAGPELEMNRGGAPGELLERIEDGIELLRVRAVFSAGHHASQAILPFGPFGALHVGAGGGGAPAHDLRRWGPADAAGVHGDVQLEARFDLALMAALDAWARDHDVPEAVLDEAKARGSWKGFTGTYDGAGWPTHGWWELVLHGPTARLVFHHRLPDGTFEERYVAVWDPGNGWRGR